MVKDYSKPPVPPKTNKSYINIISSKIPQEQIDRECFADDFVEKNYRVDLYEFDGGIAKVSELEASFDKNVMKAHMSLEKTGKVPEDLHQLILSQKEELDRRKKKKGK